MDDIINASMSDLVVGDMLVFDKRYNFPNLEIGLVISISPGPGRYESSVTSITCLINDTLEVWYVDKYSKLRVINRGDSI